MHVEQSIFQKIGEKAQSFFASMNEMIHKGVTIEEIANMVKKHESTKRSTKTYLGLTFEFYRLKVKDMMFHLEIKKGVVDKILFFQIYTNEHQVLTYRSYDESLLLTEKIKQDHLPQIVKEQTH